MLEVSAGIVRRKDGRILACRRGEGRHHAHLWEFPGGKREPGEDAAACLRRELLEELALPVDRVQTLCVREAESIRFTFLTAETAAEPVPTEHEALGFFRPRELLGLIFCPADTAVARKLALSEPELTCFLWDFDGTLADTYPQMTAYMARACAALGNPVPEERVLTLMKNSLPYATGVLADELGVSPEVLREAYEAQNRAYCPEEVRPMPGVPDALRALRGRHYLVTHRDLSVMETLRAWGVDTLFAGHMLRGDAGFVRKPSPDGILRLMADHEIPPEQAVMIGDRPLDMQAGRAAGVLTCLLDPEGRFPVEPADLRAMSAAELPALLQPKQFLEEEHA